MVYENVLILGASGQVGRPILTALLSHPSSPSQKVSVLARSVSTATFPSEVHNTHRIDFSLPASELHSALVNVFKGQDAVISALVDIDEQYKIIDAALEAGVKLFVTSEFGGDTHDEESRKQAGFLFEKKLAVQEYLREREGRMQWTGVSTGPFLDWGIANTFLGFSIPDSTATIFDKGDARFSATSLSDIGRSVAALMSLSSPLPKEVANQLIYFASCTTSQNEILSLLEKHTGKQWKKEYTETRKELREGQDLVAKSGFWPGGPMVIRGIILGGEANGFGAADCEKRGVLANRVLGLEGKTESIEEIVKKALERK